MALVRARLFREYPTITDNIASLENRFLRPRTIASRSDSNEASSKNGQLLSPQRLCLWCGQHSAPVLQHSNWHCVNRNQADVRCCSSARNPFGGTHELLPCGLLGGDLVELFRKNKPKYYWYDFTVRDDRLRGSTKETNETRADCSKDFLQQHTSYQTACSEARGPVPKGLQRQLASTLGLTFAPDQKPFDYRSKLHCSS